MYMANSLFNYVTMGVTGAEHGSRVTGAGSDHKSSLGNYTDAHL